MRIAVYCASSRISPESFLADARSLGTEVARRGHVLVYGGGKTGLMGAVADSALLAGGTVEGVILRRFMDAGVHHEGLSSLVCVDDMRERKAGLDAGADAFIVLPGGLGTLEEVAEVLSFRKIGLHQRPVVFVNTEGFFDPFLAQIDNAIAEGLDSKEIGRYFAVTRDPREAVQLSESKF